MNLKLFRLVNLVVLTIFLSVFMNCGGGENTTKHIPSTEHGTSAAYNSDYVCPMHCPGSGSNKVGICPACGMNYIELSEHMKNGHSH